MELNLTGPGFDLPLSIVEEYRRRFGLSLSLAIGIFEVFKNWNFINIRTTNQEFISSDNPLSILGPENILGSENIQIEFNDEVKINQIRNESKTQDRIKFTMTLNSVSLSDDVIIVFPVTPNISVIGFSDCERFNRNEESLSSNNVVYFINLITMHQCNKTVYSPSKELLEETKTNYSDFKDYCKKNNITPSFDIAISE